MPRERLLKIWKGNHVSFELAMERDLTGAELVFRAAWRNNGVLRKTSADQVSGFVIDDAEDGIATLSFTPEETRLVPSGSLARYEIEMRKDGVETSLYYGLIKATEWANDDAA